ncbi:sugar transporter related protein [Thermoplasma acidophilum]|uniref:Sugar transporter related protein n=1 Tax=Thermoplasma acidophilum (strain ATCC 25905 / DSM 1728 / JCM 9062 / NBRC 15155 / AMRC-C165) TaxID=273075 RepID=Q9HIG2_THEAC|nr:MFS transporter [Thermoplasma acidophilum]CAC12498.1 sugar transporter related protein [Thermoplasma acidophilum]
MHRYTFMLTISKAIRSFIFAAMAIIVPYYLSSLGLNAVETSLVIFVSLVSGAVFILLYPYVRMKLKAKMILLSALMALAFVILIITHSVYVFVAAIFIGGISLTGRDFSAYQPVEQYAISRYEQEQKAKNSAFSIYNFGSYGSAAVASLFLFLYVHYVFTYIFIVLLVLSLLQLAMYLAISFPEYNRPSAANRIPQDVRRHVSTLSALFAVDAFGGGFVTTSMLTLWFKVVYHISLGYAGFIFIIVNIVTAISILISSHISGKIGLIRTMVYTHVISNVSLILMPVIPNLIASQVFLYLRQTTSQMDVPARDSFTNTIIPPDYRVNSNSVFTTVRTIGQVSGPAIGGFLIDAMPPSLLYVAGATKIIYDISLYIKYHWFRD